MMEKLSAEEFDSNFEAVCDRIKRAAERAGRDLSEITLLAATKTVDADTVNYAISRGIEVIGENKVQEFLSKEALLKPSVRHFIGHLQTNKVKDIIGRVSLIHSVDSVRLAREISRQAQRKGITADILLEVNIAEEESKWGFKETELMLSLEEIAKLPALRVRGLMTIPPICGNSEENRKYFKKMYKIFIDIRGKNTDNSNMDILSMGMSDDFDIAVEEGATVVRVGTALFGKRNYNI